MNHKEKAGKLFLDGYNCAQSVFCAFCDETGLDFESALKLSASFGGGMGRMREVCGACSGMLMVCGTLFGYTSPTDNAEKIRHYELVQQLANEFKSKHKTIICRELLAGITTSSSPQASERTASFYSTRPCLKFVEDAAEIIEKYIESQK